MELLNDLLSDGNPMVVANAVAALTEINEARPLIEVCQQNVFEVLKFIIWKLFSKIEVFLDFLKKCLLEKREKSNSLLEKKVFGVNFTLASRSAEIHCKISTILDPLPLPHTFSNPGITLYVVGCFLLPWSTFSLYLFSNCTFFYKLIA